MTSAASLFSSLARGERDPQRAEVIPAPTTRADLLPEEYRSLCHVCGRVTIWRIVCVDGVLGGVCETCGTVTR